MTCVINIAGTNGSGKSTVARALLQRATEALPVTSGARAQPWGYDLQLPGVGPATHLIGAYVVPTGGCDTIRDVNKVFEIVEQQFALGKHVVYEGAIVMNMLRGVGLVEKYPGRVHVLLLTTPLADCVKAINGRRAEQGEAPIANRTNVEGNWKRSYTYAGKMRGAGAQVINVTREQALPKLLELLGKHV